MERLRAQINTQRANERREGRKGAEGKTNIRQTKGEEGEKDGE